MTPISLWDAIFKLTLFEKPREPRPPPPPKPDPKPDPPPPPQNHSEYATVQGVMDGYSSISEKNIPYGSHNSTPDLSEQPQRKQEVNKVSQ
jgi:hypothetical protein